MPDPLAPGHIPGQNPATPERMPGHTATTRDRHWRLAPWIAVAIVLTIVAFYALGLVGH
jgi:hypothetical protein